MKRIAGIGKGTLSTITGDRLMLKGFFVLAESLDMFKLGTIATGGNLNRQASCPYEKKIWLVGVWS
jgi:hypothetical protein